MTFCENLKTLLDPLHLLKHPFYQAWDMGILSKKTLQIYAKEYAHHVDAFPRYLSQIHALCESLEARQVLLENLIDEEMGEDNHPQLWKRFAKGLEVDASQMNEGPKLDGTKKLVQGFYDLAQKDYATGLGALYSYERQTPEVAKSKIEGLKKHYNITDPKTLQFFEVHAYADIWHTEELEGLITKLNPEDKNKVQQGAMAGAKLLWGFLDDMMEVHKAN